MTLLYLCCGAASDHVRVRGRQSAQSILTMFDERLQKQALASFEQSGVEARTGVRVVEVTQEQARPRQTW